ncbi:hypothetical protein JTS93_16625 [Clostridium botulinum]|nr:hypothetical protein [Clostridium botulinum]
MEYLGIEKFGSFLDNGAAYTIPDRPWFTDNYPGSLSERGKGNIRAIADRHEISLGNTLSNENSQIPWIHLKDGLKHIYVCKQVLATNISWDYLNERNMIYGTPVTIDGKQYKLRVLTGGVERNPDKPGMVPTDNEWDTIIQNTANITGLPKPTTEDLTEANTYGQLDGKHNQHWNWWGINTICQETRTLTSSKITRGYSSAASFTSYDAIALNSACGWRPVLEYIEIDPPSKPIPVYPTSEDKTYPEPIKGKITLQTKYNGDGYLEQMEVLVYNYTQQKFEYQTEWIDNTTGVMQLPVTFKAGNNYKITVRHKGTGGIAKGWLELYVIGGKLGKYKLSEPVTQKQYDKLTAYTSGDDLIMKPQQFPETENSVIRLVPQTMNTLTVKEDTTTEDLKYSSTTKTPTIGDKLIKDSQIYTISNIVEEQSEINVSTEIEKVTDANNSSLGWSGNVGKNSYLYNGNIYFACRTPSQVTIYKVSQAGGTPHQIWGTGITNSRGIAVVGDGNTLYTVVGQPKALAIFKTNLGTNETSKTILDIDTDPIDISATMDRKFRNLIVVMKGFVTVTTLYGIVGYRIKVDNVNSPELYKKTELDVGYPHKNIGSPFILDTGDYRSENLSVSYLRNYSDGKGQVIECLWYGDEISRKARAEINTTETGSSRISSALYTNKLGERTFMITYSYVGTTEAVGVFKQKKNEDGTFSSSSNDIIYPNDLITTLKINYDKEHGFIVVFSTSRGYIQTLHSLGYDHAWSSSSIVTNVAQRGTAPIYEVVEYNPYSYGQHPGLLILEYDETNKVDKLILRSDYTMEEPKANKLTLDKPITAQAGETIKFLDYDLEVKAREETATITPTEITDTYYEYDASLVRRNLIET